MQWVTAWHNFGSKIYCKYSLSDSAMACNNYE